MEVNIGEVNSTVRATDSASLLSPEVMERIVQAVMARVREEKEHSERAESERRLGAGATEDDQ
jgi:hypothetical protein